MGKFILPFLPIAICDVEVNGVALKLATHLQDKVHGSIFRGERALDGRHLAELDILQKAIKPGHLVIDAGANIGSVSITLAKVQPEAVIYCFEPDSVNFCLLNINILLNGVKNIRAFNYALGKKQEYIHMYLSNNNYGDHRSIKCNKNDLGENLFRLSDTKALKVNPYDFFKEYLGLKDDSKVIDLIKIDTQGADFEILEACIPLLKDDSTVTIEYSPYHLEANGTTKEAVESTLKNFSGIKIIHPLGHRPSLGDLNVQSVLDFYDAQYQHCHTYFDMVLMKQKS